jgi:hypothetical protein
MTSGVGATTAVQHVSEAPKAVPSRLSRKKEALVGALITQNVLPVRELALLVTDYVSNRFRFDQADWRRLGLEMQPFRPSPEMEEFLDQDCVFELGAIREETHIVVAIAPKVEVIGAANSVQLALTSNLIVKRAGPSEAMHRPLLSSRVRAEMEQSAEQAGYLVMTRNCVPGSECERAGYKRELLETNGYSTQPVNAHFVAICMLVAYIAQGKWLCDSYEGQPQASKVLACVSSEVGKGVALFGENQTLKVEFSGTHRCAQVAFRFFPCLSGDMRLGSWHQSHFPNVCNARWWQEQLGITVAQSPVNAELKAVVERHLNQEGRLHGFVLIALDQHVSLNQLVAQAKQRGIKLPVDERSFYPHSTNGIVDRPTWILIPKAQVVEGVGASETDHLCLAGFCELVGWIANRRWTQMEETVCLGSRLDSPSHRLLLVGGELRLSQPGKIGPNEYVRSKQDQEAMKGRVERVYKSFK